MGELSPAPLLLDFDARLRLEFRGATLTSDAGLLALRELDDALGLTDRAAQFLSDARTGLNVRHDFGVLLRQSLVSRIARYDDVNDADRLVLDPALRLVTGRFDQKRSAASSRTLGPTVTARAIAVPRLLPDPPSAPCGELELVCPNLAGRRSQPVVWRATTLGSQSRSSLSSQVVLQATVGGSA